MRTLLALLILIPSLSWGSDDLTGKNLICKNIIKNEIILIEFLKESEASFQKWIDAHINSQKKAFEDAYSFYPDAQKIFKPNLDSIPELIPNYVEFFRGKINAKEKDEFGIMEHRLNYKTDLENIDIYQNMSQTILKSRWGYVNGYGLTFGVNFKINRQKLTLLEDKSNLLYECQLAKKYEIKEWKEDLILRFKMEEYRKNKENEEQKKELKNNQKI